MAIYIRNKRNGVYWLRFALGNRDIHESTGFADKARAQEYHDRRRLELLDKSRLKRKPDRAWPEAAGQWLVEHEDKRSLEKDREILRWLHPHLGRLRLSEVTREAVDRIRQIKRRETSAATANRYMALVRAILRKAVEWEWLDRAPKVSMYAGEQERIPVVSPEQAAALVAELPPHLAVMARFALETGLRRHNVTHLRWSQIDLGTRTAWIHADQAKGKRSIGVPLSTEACIILQAQVGAHRDYVFVYKGAPVYQTATRAWRKACARAGLPGLRWHDLRHIWASWHAQSGTPLLALKEMGGWQSLAMVQRYAHFSTGHLQDFADRVSRQNPYHGQKLRLVKSG